MHDQRRDTSHVTTTREVQDATRTLVDAYTSGGPGRLVRALASEIVALGLSSGASIWSRANDRDESTELVRSGEFSGDATGAAKDTQMELSLGEGIVLRLVREPSDLDGHRDEREDLLESLALLAATLLEDAEFGDLPPGPAPTDRRPA